MNKEQSLEASVNCQLVSFEEQLLVQRIECCIDPTVYCDNWSHTQSWIRPLMDLDQDCLGMLKFASMARIVPTVRRWLTQSRQTPPIGLFVTKTQGTTGKHIMYVWQSMWHEAVVLGYTFGIRECSSQCEASAPLVLCCVFWAMPSSKSGSAYAVSEERVHQVLRIFLAFGLSVLVS